MRAAPSAVRVFVSSCFYPNLPITPRPIQPGKGHKMLRLFAVPVVFTMAIGALAAEEPKPISGNSVIRAKAGDSDIVITTTSRLAGAIHSLTWNGKEFIDSL